jgi:hypothetical protein
MLISTLVTIGSVLLKYTATKDINRQTRLQKIKLHHHEALSDAIYLKR